MKKLLFTLIAFIAIAAAAPVAQAGQFARVYSKHGPVYLHKSQVYGGKCYSGSRHRYSKHRSHHRSYYSRPVYYSRSNYYSRPSYYSRPVYYSRSSYSHYNPHCGYRSSPRISFAFGF